MVFVMPLALVDIALRLNDYHARAHPTAPVLVISIVVAALVAVGATFGGSLVFEHWLAVAHNRTRWTSTIGTGEPILITEPQNGEPSSQHRPPGPFRPPLQPPPPNPLALGHHLHQRP